MLFQDPHDHRRSSSSSMVGNSSSKQLSSYYESLRSNVMSILGQVKVSGSNEMMHEPAVAASMSSSSTTMSSKENFDSYLTKLQTICTENMNSEEVKPINHCNGGLAAAPMPTSI